MVKKSVIFVEKYRPDTLAGVIGQDEIVRILKSYVETGQLQHMLFSGPPGVGKTTAAIALAKDMYGKEWKSNFLELNASDERGLDVVRKTIKDFAGTAPMYGQTYKIIFLDEADALTKDAQAALRRITEKFSRSCIFIFSCNYVSKVIGPIQSRCAIYRFKYINDDFMEKKIREIVNKEKLKIDDDSVKSIVYVADGDMRKAINVLQSSTLLASLDGTDSITVDKVYLSSGMARKSIIDELIKVSLEGDFIKAFERLDYLIFDEGVTGTDLCAQMVKSVFDMNIPDIKKIAICDRIGEIDFRLTEGANDTVQIKALISHIMLVGSKGGN